MAVGQGSLFGGLSYVAIGRETTLGTYSTCTSALDALSAAMKTTMETKTLEQIERSRSYSKQIQLSKTVGGDTEFYFDPMSDACTFILQNALGGTITSATATGETVGGTAMTHTFNIGNMDNSYPSLCMNVRKGEATSGRVFQYHGLRVDEFGIKAEIDEGVMASVKFIGIDSTQVSNDVSGSLTSTQNVPLTFIHGRLSVETAFSSLTSTSFWHIQSVEFGIKNNLKGDKDSRRIGSSILTVLPPGMAEFTLKCKIRFDTTTAYAAMINETKLSAQLAFVGPTITSSAIARELRLTMPKVYIKEAGDPEIGGPDEILMSEVEFNVLREETSTSAYPVIALITNTKASYA